MNMQQFRSANGQILAIHEIGSGPIDCIWAHGWGQTHTSLLPIAQSLAGSARHLLLDLPGFGFSPPPSTPWGTSEYSEVVNEWLQQIPRRPRAWVGHSFGCRVGIRLAASHTSSVDGLFLVAAAGVRPPVKIHVRVRRYLRARAFKLLKFLALSEAAKDQLRERWGSPDYRHAGPLRGTLVRVVNEDLGAVSKKILVPVRLIYGANDSETPASVGKLFNSLIANSQLVVLPKYGHLDILTEGRFQVQSILKEFLSDLCK